MLKKKRIRHFCNLGKLSVFQQLYSKYQYNFLGYSLSVRSDVRFLLNLYYHVIVIFVSTWIYVISLWIFLLNIKSKMTLLR